MSKPKPNILHPMIIIGVAMYFVIMQQIAPSIQSDGGREFVGYLTVALLSLALVSVIRSLQINHARKKAKQHTG